MSYTTILFDADNTLFDFTRSEHDALQKCLIARNLPHGDDTVAVYSAINDKHWKMLERGEITREALRISRFTEFFAVINADCDPVVMADDYMLALSEQHVLIDGAEALCRELADKCRLYLITNGSTFIQTRRFSASPIYPLFEAIFISEALGVEKPQRAYFDAVAAQIPDFDPATTLVVGDSLTSDIRGGINAGLDTCWYNPKGKPHPADMPVIYIAPDFDTIRRIILT